MKKALALSAAVIASFGLALAYLNHQPDAKVERVAKHAARVQSSRESGRPSIERKPSPGDAPTTSLASASKPRSGESAGDASAIADTAGNQPAQNPRLLYQDPKFRSTQVSLQSEIWRSGFSQFFKDQKMSRQQIEEFLKIVGETDVRAMEMVSTDPSSNTEQGYDLAAYRKHREYLKAEQDAQLSSLLGDKYAQYKEYEKSLREQEMVEDLNGMLINEGHESLSKSQRKQLVEIYSQEKVLDKMSRKQMGKDDLKRILNRLRPLLDEEQYKQLETQLVITQKG